MEENIEMEKKYLIVDGGTQTAEDSFNTMRVETRIIENIDDFVFAGFVPKKRPYRYFDTFDTRLTAGNILTYIGPLQEKGISLSTRQREDGYVLTVKFPQGSIPEERLEDELHIPAGTDFYALDPNDFIALFPPLKRVKDAAGGKLLQEIIRLEVDTHRFDFSRENEKKVQVALDMVTGTMPFGTCTFYELEIEKIGSGEDVDVEAITSFFKKKYNPSLVEDSRPKWIKARDFIREGK